MVINGDSLKELKKFEDNHFDSVVTDPPYGIEFMGSKWDYDVPTVELWKEVFRVLKPGGYLLAFAGTRTQHRMAVNIEDAGFEIRDMIAWVYGSGFPKSRNIGKDVEKTNVGGLKNLKQVGTKKGAQVSTGTKGFSYSQEYVPGKSMGGKTTTGDIPVYEINNEWEGWGTALKPALEPITMARKPLQEPNVAKNVMKYGTGGINIDGCRIETEDKTKRKNKGVEWGIRNDKSDNQENEYGSELGRFPANLIHDGSDEVKDVFPNVGSGNNFQKYNYNEKEYDNKETSMFNGDKPDAPSNYNDKGSASRFFYCAKASKLDRNEGLEKFEPSEKYTAGNYSQSPVCVDCHKTLNGTNNHSRCSGEVYYREMQSKNTKNNHPTVKPTHLMKYLCRLVTPKGGIVLDPFLGSGSTGKACVYEEFSFVGIDLSEEYCNISKARIEAAEKHKKLLDSQLKLF